MQKRRIAILVLLAALAAVVFILTKLALSYYFYWLYWWYDVMLHALTGFVVGGLAGWIVFRYADTISLSHMLAWVLGITLVVGIGWEFFEYFTGQYVGEANIFTDTIADLLLDTLGALLAGLLLKKLLGSTPLPA